MHNQPTGGGQAHDAAADCCPRYQISTCLQPRLYLVGCYQDARGTSLAVFSALLEGIMAHAPHTHVCLVCCGAVNTDASGAPIATGLVFDLGTAQAWPTFASEALSGVHHTHNCQPRLHMISDMLPSRPLMQVPLLMDWHTLALNIASSAPGSP